MDGLQHFELDTRVLFIRNGRSKRREGEGREGMKMIGEDEG